MRQINLIQLLSLMVLAFMLGVLLYVVNFHPTLDYEIALAVTATLTSMPTPEVDSQQSTPLTPEIEPSATSAPTEMPTASPTPTSTEPNFDNLLRAFYLYAVYPDLRLRQTTLYYPDEAASGGGSETLTVMSANAYFGPDDIISAEPIGGTVIESQALKEYYAPCVGDGFGFGAIQMLLSREKNGSPYGVDTMLINPSGLLKTSVVGEDFTTSVYGTIDPLPGETEFAIAIALPQGSHIKIDDSSIESYQQIEIDGWVVYYFNKLYRNACDTLAILIFRPGEVTPPDLDVFRVDSLR